jgi:hypothetical protein
METQGNGHVEEAATNPPLVVSRENIVEALQSAEVATRKALEMLNVAIERACGRKTAAMMQQAAVWDARAALLRHSAQMLGMTAIDMRQVA